MNAHTGRAIDGIDHIRQSIQDILATPIGSRVMRRDYGSLIPDLIDQPLNDATLLRVYATAVMAITRWEDRLQITAIRRRVRAERPGTAVLEIEGITNGGDNVQLEVSFT